MKCEWRCNTCGYSYTGEEPLSTCPYCGSGCPFVNKSYDCRENPEACQKPWES
ncbi:MAG: hypothetical protein V3V92_03840 [Candidatus Hydrothermarchaeales archaeon]